MTYEGILTFIGIIVAILAIAQPVQMQSIRLFVPLRLLYFAIVVASVLLICRDLPLGWNPFGLSLAMAKVLLDIAAFGIPVAAAVWCGYCWNRAKLIPHNSTGLEPLLETALRENRFDEVQRVLSKNQDRLSVLPPEAIQLLYDSRMVAAFVGSNSLLHLSMLADLAFLRSLEDRSRAVDAVVREILRSDVSPVRAMVTSQFGGCEGLSYTAVQKELMNRTFLNSEWYYEAGAHYPLLFCGNEDLRKGQMDVTYNSLGTHYEASQGISSRSGCPLYLGLKVHVLAIHAALKQGNDKDFFVTDLLDMFRFVLQRSRYQPDTWNSPLVNSEHPTPFAYLLRETLSDLRHLSAAAVEALNSRDHPNGPHQIAMALARTWSGCVRCIADSRESVSARFRASAISQYLEFVLQLGWQPTDVFFKPFVETEPLCEWRDLFASELRRAFQYDLSGSRVILSEGINGLDGGKVYVMRGREWLRQELGF
jgi:hypothetical protein